MSLVNMVENFFTILPQQRLKGRSLPSMKRLEETMKPCTGIYKRDAIPLS